MDQLLGNHVTERLTEPGTQVLEPPKPQPPVAKAPKVSAPKQRQEEPPVANPEPKPPADPNDPPLFENDVDELFGKSLPPRWRSEADAADRAGPDAIGLYEKPRAIALSAQQATLLTGGVVVMLALAFAAGYFLAR